MIPALDFSLRFICFACCHSLLATDRCKNLIIGPGTPRNLAKYRIGYNIIASVQLVWVMASWPTAPILYVASGTWYLALRGLQLAIAIAIINCARQTGLGELLGLRPQAATATLVTTGCYRVVRHPLYTLGFLFLALNPAPSGKWVLFTLLSAIYCVIASRWEEQRLSEQFGEDYRTYKQLVPAFVPRCKSCNLLRQDKQQ